MRSLLLCLLVALGLSPACEASAAPTDTGKKVVGYYIAWARDARSFPPEKIDARKLTHINYAFANIVDGKVVMGDPVADMANFAGLRALKKTNPKLKLLVSVGGVERKAIAPARKTSKTSACCSKLCAAPWAVSA